MFMNSLNDPFIFTTLDFDIFKKNPNVVLTTNKYAGHIGYHESAFSLEQWFSQPALDFIDSLEVQHLTKQSVFETWLKNLKYMRWQVRNQLITNISGRESADPTYELAAKREEEQKDRSEWFTKIISEVAEEST